MQCYNIPFTVQPEQTKATRVVIMSQEETDLVDQETRKMLSKGTISVAKNLDGQFLSALLLVGKKDGGGRGGGESSSDQSERIEESGPLCTLWIPDIRKPFNKFRCGVNVEQSTTLANE